MGRILGRLRASFSLFAFALRDRGQISVAIDGLFAHVFPATEQEYCKRDRDHCAQYGAKRPIPYPVVAHHQLRSFRLGQRPRGIEVPAGMSAGGTAADRERWQPDAEQQAQRTASHSTSSTKAVTSAIIATK